MTDYVKSTNFSSKDSLPVGNPLKIVRGTEIDTEFNNIAVAVATKADKISPVFEGTPTAPTATAGTNSDQLATTAFVQAEKVNPSFSGETKVDVLKFSDTGWSIDEDGTTLYFKYNGVKKAKLDTDGNLTTVADITAYGTV